MWIAIDSIVRKTGGSSNSKLQQMRKALRNGAKFPPISVALIEDTLREHLGRQGLCCEDKVYFLLEGHHRCDAMELEKRTMIEAKVVRKLY